MKIYRKFNTIIYEISLIKRWKFNRTHKVMLHLGTDILEKNFGCIRYRKIEYFTAIKR